MGPLMARVLVLLAADGEAPGLPCGGGPLGCLEDLGLAGDPDYASALLISLTARLGRVSRVGGSSRCSQRVCWPAAGPWAGSGASAGACGTMNEAKEATARLRRDARTVDWTLRLWAGRIEEVRIGARVERIRGLPGCLEGAFG